MATISGGCRETRWSSSGPGGWNDFTARLAIARRSILLAQMMPDLISDLDGGNAFGGFCLAAHLRQLAAAHGRAAAISHRRTACNVLEEFERRVLDGLLALQHHTGVFYAHRPDTGAYHDLDEATLRAALYLFLEDAQWRPADPFRENRTPTTGEGRRWRAFSDRLHRRTEAGATAWLLHEHARTHDRSRRPDIPRTGQHSERRYRSYVSSRASQRTPRAFVGATPIASRWPQSRGRLRQILWAPSRRINSGLIYRSSLHSSDRRHQRAPGARRGIARQSIASTTGLCTSPRRHQTQ
jgi:hypothetical protein